VFAGYAQAAGDRLGNIDFAFENIGPNTAYIRLMYFDGATPPSGFVSIDTTYTGTWLGFVVQPGGVLTRSYVLNSKIIGFFGSGNTVVNISCNIRNKADLRNAQIDIVAMGRQGWGFDQGFDRTTLTKKWGAIIGPTTTSGNINAGYGLLSPTAEPPGTTPQTGGW
jgi:hypothetical protein